jgi:hypothetical protein
MTAATLDISKVITVITGNCVYTTKLANILIEANKYDVIDFKGRIKTKKLNKYLIAFIANGYSVVTENWNRVNTISDGSSDFSITLSKNV